MTGSPTRAASRRPSGAAAVALALPVLALLLAACAGEDTTAGTGAGAGPSRSEPATALTVVVDLGDGSAPREWTLTCDPPGGTHPDPAAACAMLESAGEEVLPPVPRDTMCTQQWGGPQTARVTGRWRGEDVSADFGRGDGCQIHRWDRARDLLVEPGGA